MNRIPLSLVLAALLLAPSPLAGSQSPGQSAGAQSRQPLRYVNPLSVQDSIGMGDPTVIRFKGTYYLYATGGSQNEAWSSPDLVHWTHHLAQLTPQSPVVAPDVFEYQGSLYLTGNDLGLYRSSSPLGPWQYIGDFHDRDGNKILPFDPMVMVDSDRRVYLYYSGRSTNGIFGVELSHADLTRFAGPVQHLFKFEKSHRWERYGTYNEYSQVSWIEGPWMTRHNGTYYLQYSAAGTDWPTYAVGVYTSRNPLGPFTYDPRSPVLRHKQGLLTGTGHHCVVEGPGGQLWAFYTIVYHAWNRMADVDRRIGMDRVGFDRNGNLFIAGPTETPQLAPGVQPPPHPAQSLPLSVDAAFKVSSEAPGRSAPYAFDDSTKTWWEPAATDTHPWLLLDLGAATDLDPLQEFTVNSARILFSLPPLRRRELTAPTGVYRYKIEVSRDGQTFQTVVDRSQNQHLETAPFDEIAPVVCRYVKLTLSDWPNDLPLGIIEFTVFGQPVDDMTPRKRPPEEARRVVDTISPDR